MPRSGRHASAPAVRNCRREFLRWGTAACVGHSVSPWFKAFADQATQNPGRKRACILLWMSGGPSQLDTFDPKPDHENGGPFEAIETAAAGVRICEHLPKLATQMQHLVPIRSMQSKEGDHSRGTFYLRTGYLPQGPVAYPSIGSLVSKENGNPDSDLPRFVSIAPLRLFSPNAYSSGFLGPQFAPLIVGEPNYGQNPVNDGESLSVQNLGLPAEVSAEQFQARRRLLGHLESRFSSEHPGSLSQGHQAAYAQAARMMRPESAVAFDLSQEKETLRDAYGRNSFGQGCLMARRLIERGVAFVEVSLNNSDGRGLLGWDTHNNNFERVEALCGALDSGWATLLIDLHNRGLLDSTLVIWMGEFGRTPKINTGNGRDHFPNAWTTVLGGGGVHGGQVVGKTSNSGMTVADRPVAVPDLLATVGTALGIDPLQQNMSNVGRPIRFAEHDAKPIKDIVQ